MVLDNRRKNNEQKTKNNEMRCHFSDFINLKISVVMNKETIRKNPMLGKYKKCSARIWEIGMMPETGRIEMKNHPAAPHTTLACSHGLRPMRLPAGRQVARARVRGSDVPANFLEEKIRVHPKKPASIEMKLSDNRMLGSKIVVGISTVLSMCKSFGQTKILP